MVCLAGCDFTPWKSVHTQNTEIFYKPGSYAQKHIQKAKQQYEYAVQDAVQFLPQINLTPKVKVYLYEKLKSKGFAKPEMREVHFRYGEEFRLTSSHEFLHIFLYEYNKKAPLRFEEGVCRIREGKRKKFKGKMHQILYYQLVKFSPKENWKAELVFKDHYKTDDEGNIAAAFALFTQQELGMSKFWKFYQELTKKNWRQKLQEYFGKSISQIDQDFVVFVKSIPDPPEAFKFKFSPETAHLHK